MLTLYAIPVSLYCAKLRILLRHKGLTWRELPPPGGYGSQDYKKIVVSGNLPALMDDDLLLADSEAIAEYLNEKFLAPPMLPESLAARAEARACSRFHDTRLEPELRKLFAEMYVPPERRDRELCATQSAALTERLHQFARLRLEFSDAATGAVSLGDCGFPITFAWIGALTPRLNLQIDWPQEILTYRQWLEQQPAIAAELADYVPKLQAYLAQIGGHAP